MICSRCTTPTHPYAVYGPNACRRCPLCSTFVVGPRGGMVADSHTFKRPVIGQVRAVQVHV
ncbi:MAG TPA: hypothetical protein VGW38_19490 [Chloroflexota bacterium]|nr:hypothetical protein [Chloroflexota bacterium]